MTNEEAIGNLKHAIRWNDMPKKEALDMAIKALEKQKAISELQPPTDNWETYANRLYDLAYLSGYNDGLLAKGNQDNNV